MAEEAPALDHAVAEHGRSVFFRAVGDGSLLRSALTLYAHMVLEFCGELVKAI
jgi:hypothetical protein